MPWRAFTATTTIQKAASYNTKRKSLSLLNAAAAGGNDVAYSQDPTGVLTQGFILKPGATVTLNKEDGDEPEADLFVVTTAGTVDLRVQEGIGA